MFDMANAPVILVPIHTCLRTKSNVLSAKVTTRSESNLVAVTKMTKALADVEKGRGKGKRTRQERIQKQVCRRPEWRRSSDRHHHSSVEVQGNMVSTSS